MARDFPPAGIDLPADAIRVYAKIAKQEALTGDDVKQVDALVEWGLVGFDLERPDVPVAMDPHEATQRILAAELAHAREQVARLTALPALADQLGTHYARAQRCTGGGSEYLDDPSVVNARLDDVIAGAREEILAAQPSGPRDRDQLNRSVDRDQAALGRGVRLRTLYRDSVRDYAVTAEYAQIMTGLGASYRTRVDPYERMIVVDRRVAFIADRLGVGDASRNAAWCVTDRATVAWIAQVFEETWRVAAPWHGELRHKAADGPVEGLPEAGRGIRTNPFQRAILRDMAHGDSQQKTADRLGISLRSLSGHIADLRALFDAASLPELTYKWALSPDRLVDDSKARTAEAGGAGPAAS